MLKKPLRRALKSIVSANGWIVATVHENDKAEQMVRELNAYDALLAACEALCSQEMADAYECLEFGPGGTIPEVQALELIKRNLRAGRAAISKARPEPASRPDVSC